MAPWTVPSFLGDTMTQIIQFRQAGALCDVTLTVGRDQIQAHRCVLAARSEYFRTLFLCQFKDASMDNINLSDVTDDIKPLEEVVDFMYTGKIGINNDNLRVLVKLSTYLWIESLREICAEYMIMQRFDLRTCLDNYFYSVEYSLDEAEQEERLLITSRFHDYYIHEENLDLSPSEVQLLLKKGMFQYCTAMSMLQFVFKWLVDEATEQHISVATQILDTIEEQRYGSLSEIQSCQINEMVVKIDEMLHDKENSVIKLFLEKLQKILPKIIIPKLEIESNSCQVKSGSSSANLHCLSTGYEEVIITLSPKKCVEEHFREITRSINKPVLSLSEPTFTLCCYIPNTKTWHHVDDLQTGEAIDYLPKPYGQSCTVISTLYREELALISGNICEKVHFYHLRKKSWRAVNLPNFSEESSPDCFDVINYCVTNGDNCMYIIVKIIFVPMDYEESDGEFFIGLKLSEDGGAERVFKTSLETNTDCECNEMHAKVSEVSNELIFTCGPLENLDYGRGFNYVYIVDLNEDQPVALNLCKERTQRLWKGLLGVKILQTRSHFYILYDGTTDSPENGEIQIVSKYKFNSKVLISQHDVDKKVPNKTKSLVENNLPDVETEGLDERNLPGEETKRGENLETGLTINKYRYHEEDVIFPSYEEFTVSNKNSLWSFEGDIPFFSSLHKIEIEDDRRFTLKEHAPPPFSSVTVMAVGELPADLVSKLAATPEGKFLDSDDACQ